MRPPRPPRLAQRLVALCFRGESREVILGDLSEGFETEVRHRGRRAAARWYWRHALASAAAITRPRSQSPEHTLRRPGGGDSTVAHLIQDLRIALRSLRRAPGFTTVVVLTLGLGIGTTTAIFSVVHGVLIVPPPFPGAERQVYAPRQQLGTGVLQYYWSHQNYRYIKERATSFEIFEGVRLGSAVLTGRDQAQRFFVRYVTPRFLDMYGARPQLGRMIDDEDDQIPGGHPVVVITHKIWQSYFGGDPEILGTSVNLSGAPYTVVGVLNPEFSYPFGQDLGSEVDLWAPAMMAGAAHARGDSLFAERTARAFSILGVIKEDVTPEQAQEEVDRLAAQLAEDHPTSNRGYGIKLRLTSLSRTARARGPLLVLLTASAVLLLIGCFNIANLMLVRGAHRERELAVRLALGAGRRGLLRFLAAEAFLVTLAGGTLGVLLANAGLPVLLSIVSGSLRVYATQLPPAAQVSMNGTVILVAGAMCVLAGVVFGVLPALRVTRVDLRTPLAGTAPADPSRGSRLRSGLVVFEIATATVLLSTSGVLLRSMNTIREIDVGYRSDRVLTFRVGLPTAKYGTTEALASVTERLRQRVATEPGIEWAQPWGPGLPAYASAPGTAVPQGMVVDELRDAPRARAHRIGPGALADLQVPVRRGREFTTADRLGTQPVAIVSETLAVQLWPGRDPIGQYLHPFAPAGVDRDEITLWRVVGVADDAMWDGPVPTPGGLDSPADVFYPAAQRPMQELYFVVGTTGEPSLAPIQTAVRAVDMDIPLYEVSTLSQHIARPMGPTRFATLLMGTFALAALLLAGLGVYGVVAFSVTQRTREIGLRSALGAARGDTLRLFLRHGARLAAAGVVLGSVGALALGKLLSSLIFGVSSGDALALLAAAVSLTAVAIAACFIPARRATLIAPAEALRQT
ncbi:MAG: ABC transporter permease [Gemmatimonadetes bacterium]|nr:ABC transporter permease [Gemmatimonadota bacterium]